jgi:hypothetical protein
MFIDNKYTKWYYNIVNNRKNNPIDEGEKHHIIPKSLGGNNKENLVKLTYREHYICHLLLTKMCLNKNDTIRMCWALHRLTFSKTIFTGHQYEISRKIHIKNLIDNHPSQKQSWRDKVSDVVFSQWENNEERRLKTSKKMSETWETQREKLTEHNKKISKLGAAAAKEKISKKIEFEGKIYVGWSSLLEETGISKHLYVKYYMNGIDPRNRIGANGPISR